MSDYLWDKSGEADPEVERLENLLGQLRYQPTPFDLPRELPRPADFRAARARTLLSWPRLAVAASLTLALLFGAWLVLNDRQARTTGGEVARGSQPGAEQPQQQSGAQQGAVDGGAEGKEGGGVDKDGGAKDAAGEKVSPKSAPKPRVIDHAALPPKPRLPLIASRGRKRGARPEATNRTPQDFVASSGAARQYTREEIETAEKLLYALRVTSEKLSYAQRQVQEIGRGDDPRR